MQHLKGISSLFAAASQNLKPVWFLPKSKSTYRFLKKWLYNKMRNRNKAGGVVGTNPRKYGWLYFTKHKWHASTCMYHFRSYRPLSLLAIKIKIKSTHLMDF